LFQEAGEIRKTRKLDNPVKERIFLCPFKTPAHHEEGTPLHRDPEMGVLVSAGKVIDISFLYEKGAVNIMKPKIFLEAIHPASDLFAKLVSCHTDPPL